MKALKAQTEWVLAQLRAGRKLTPHEAMKEKGIMRLGARIWDIKQKRLGVEVKTRMRVVINRFGKKCRVAQYYIEPPKPRPTKTQPPERKLFETAASSQSI